MRLLLRPCSPPTLSSYAFLVSSSPSSLSLPLSRVCPCPCLQPQRKVSLLAFRMNAHAVHDPPPPQTGGSQGGKLADPESDPIERTEEVSKEEQPKKLKEQLGSRVIYGFAIGMGVLGVVLAGGWAFASSMSVVILFGTDEYFTLLASHGKMTPPPPLASRVCCAVCALMPLLTMYFGGRIGMALTTTAFALVTVVLLQREKPRFSQLSSAIFGLFYCGYLPCFWVKLRCCLNISSLNARWPALLGGHAHWTVGLVATLISISCVIAADTGAFFGGKILGKTPLTSVSPKKTLEGAAVGLSAAIAVSLLLARLFLWPASLISAGALGGLIFLASLFGDLTESMIKRDVGVKDSGRLIPGHGGILDRTDSYIFTGALVYFFVKFGLPLYGL